MEHQKDSRSESGRPIGQNNQGLIKDQAFQGYGFILRKAEKLTTALYMVTDILSDKEPMKWRARETGVDVLSDITVAASASTSEKMSALRIVLKKIERIVSFLDIASSTRMISDMNASVLKKEYLALKDNVEAEWTRTHERSKSILNERFFEVREDAPLELAESERKQAVSDMRNREVVRDVFASSKESSIQTSQTEAKRREVLEATPKIRTDIKDTPYTPRPQSTPPPSFKDDSSALGSVSLETSNSTSVPPTSSVVRTVMGVPVTPVAPRYQPPVRPPVRVLSDSDVIARSRPDVTKDDRRKIILALIKQKPAITVGDIAKSIPGVSEKTIQRELLSMVADNVLVKRGERRWSTYSLREG